MNSEKGYQLIITNYAISNARIYTCATLVLNQNTCAAQFTIPAGTALPEEEPNENRRRANNANNIKRQSLLLVFQQHELRAYRKAPPSFLVSQHAMCIIVVVGYSTKKATKCFSSPKVMLLLRLAESETKEQQQYIQLNPEMHQ